MKVKMTQEKQVTRPTTVIKIKKRKLFEEITTPVSKSKEALLPIWRTTKSMAKKMIVPNISSLQKEPIDILSSLEKGSGCGATVSEAEGLATVSEIEGLVIETLMAFRKEKEAQEEITKEATKYSSDKSLNKQRLIAKIERLKQEVEEYKVLDRHIKEKNA
jgi:translation initiation factor 1 (eIF-1/SUI1)